MKKIIAIFVVLAILAIPLTACGTKTAETTAAVTTTLATTAAATPAETTAAATTAAATTSAAATSAAATETTAQVIYSGPPVTLTIAADAVPHTELLEFVKDDLAKQGITLKIVTLSGDSYATVNEQTADGEFDANFFQHLPYLTSVISEKGYKLVSIGGIHVEPIGFYSTKYKSVSEIPDKATFAIPNDTTNEYRALKILEQNGFIKLKSTIQNYSATVADIETYIKPITIVELDSANIIRVNDQFDGYITNTNKILEAGLDPNSALFREGADSPYANIIVTATNRATDPALLAVVSALRTEKVRQFILDKYKGAVIPAF
jgi:D-methionine transport system substrate-binding protein